MSKFVKDFLNKPISIKAPFILIVLIIGYFILYSFIDFLEYRRQNDDFNRLNFSVSNASYERMYSERTYNDGYLLLNLENPINKDQFDKLEVTLKDEVVEKEFVSEKQIKIVFKSPFRKSVVSDLNIKFYGRNIYNFVVRNSSIDEEFRIQNPIIEPVKY